MKIFKLLTLVTTFAAVLSFGSSQAHAEAANGQDYTVQPGDNLSVIAQNYETTYVRIFDANSAIIDPDLIYAGDKLHIPGPNEQLADREIPANYVVAHPVAPTYSAPVAKTAKPVATPKAVVNYSDGGVWSSLAQCESGGNWAINTGNGFYGGLQFDRGTWLSNGGGAYAPTADQATPEQQIEIASRVAANRGYSPWPACSARLGL